MGIENKLIGQEINKPESREKGLVVAVADGWLPSTFQVTFQDGSKSQYDREDIRSLLTQGQSRNSMYSESIKLKKDTLIEGKIIKAGTEVKITENAKTEISDIKSRRLGYI